MTEEHNKQYEEAAQEYSNRNYASMPDNAANEDYFKYARAVAFYCFSAGCEHVHKSMESLLSQKKEENERLKEEFKTFKEGILFGDNLNDKVVVSQLKAEIAKLNEIILYQKSTINSIALEYAELKACLREVYKHWGLANEIDRCPDTRKKVIELLGKK